MRGLFLFLLFIFITYESHAQDSDYFYSKGYEFLYSDKDSSYYNFERAISGYQKAKDIDNELAAYFGLLYANGYYYDLKAYKKNLSFFEKRVYTRAKLESAYFTYFKDGLYLEKINYHYKLGNSRLAQVYLDSLSAFQAIRKEIERDVDYYDTSVSAGMYQGSIYKSQNKLNLALEKYQQLEGYIAKHKDSLPNFKDKDLSIKRLKAKTYASLGQIDRAILTQINALELIQDEASYANSRLDIELDLAANLIATNELSEARELLEILDKKEIEKSNFKMRLLDQKIALSRIEKDTAKNQQYHREIIDVIKGYRQVEEHPDLINAFINYASDLRQWGDYNKALTYLNKASNLPLIRDSKQQTFTNSKIKLALSIGYLQVYKSQDLSKIPATDILLKSRDILKALDELQPQFESKLDKQYLIDTTYPALQTAFVLMYELYNSGKDRKFLDQAFAISEKSKAIELRSIRQAGIAQRSLKVDPEIIEKENLFNFTINQLEKDLFTDKDRTAILQDSLLRQKEAYGDFVEMLRTSYGDYYNLKYRNDILSLSESFTYQNPQEAILSFFQVNDALYVLKLENKKASIKELLFSEEVQQKVREYYEMISSGSALDHVKNSNLAQELYDVFLKPIFPEGLPKSLVVIPDGLLHYIPFEALQNDGSYLVQNTIVSYKPSISFQGGLSMDQIFPTNLVGFAPSFKVNTTKELPALSYNEQELEEVHSYFSGKRFSGEKGTLDRFRESVTMNLEEQKQLIYHFATHAITNDTLPEYSYLAFYPKEKEEDYILYAKELYNQQLNAAMVVLSACETGLGKLENGQGMQSLAQGFYYAGASSLVYSKWKVSDQQTATMMSLFYKYLEEGSSKDKALQQAKMSYLEKVDDPNLRHPFYWASFVFSGDKVAIESASSIPFIVWIIAGVAVIILLMIFLKKRS